MRKMMIIALGLTLFPSALIPIRPNIQPRAELVRRFYRSGDFIAVAQEAALDLKSHASGPDDMVAIRICSRSPMPLALSKSGISPFYMLPYLEHYGFTPDRISFLRSEDCLNDDHTITATEFWAVPKGATPPSSSESIKSCQAQSELVGLESPIKSESVFKATLRQFITKLQARPKAVGIVGGYYYRSPSRVIRQKLREAQICLEQNGISRSRYFISLQRWPGENNLTSPEPKYPEMEIIEIFDSCNQPHRDEP